MARHRSSVARGWSGLLVAAALAITSLGFGLVVTLPAAAAGAPPHSIGVGHPLRSGGLLASPNGFVVLLMQTDGNLALRAGGQLLWLSHSSGRGNFAQVQSNGNFAIFNASRRMLWTSGTRGPGAALSVDNTGDMMLRSGNRVLWSTRTLASVLRPTVHLGPGAFLVGSGGERMVMRPDGSLVVYRGATELWSSPTHVAGSYAVVRPSGSLVIFTPQHRALWATRTTGAGARLVVLGSGNVELRSAAGRLLWQTGTIRPQTAAQLATVMLKMWGGKVSGTPGARADLIATSRSQAVASPCGGRVQIDVRVVKFLVQLTGKFRVKINNIVTGHSCDSGGHPRGRATDLGSVTELATGAFTSFGGVAGPDNRNLDRLFVNYISTILPTGAGLGQRNCPGRSAAHPRAGVQYFADSCNHQHVQVQPSR